MDFFPHYILEYAGMSFAAVFRAHGPDAITRIKTVISNGLPAKYRDFCRPPVKSGK